MKKYIKHFFEHWKTSLGGVCLVVFTVMCVMKAITVTEWITAVGFILGTWLMSAKDPDKTEPK
jgi:hypothetical protein